MFLKDLAGKYVWENIRIQIKDQIDPAKVVKIFTSMISLTQAYQYYRPGDIIIFSKDLLVCTIYHSGEAVNRP